MPLIVAPMARQDIAAILRFSQRTWGTAQRSAYEVRLDGALHRIARMPEIGHRASTLPDTIRLLTVGSHVIVYRLTTTRIVVLRILHQRMSSIRHLRPG